MPAIYTPIAVCPGCDSDVLNDQEGRTVDPDGGIWHPDCRRVHQRKHQASAEQPRRGPGRPRKDAGVPA